VSLAVSQKPPNVGPEAIWESVDQPELYVPVPASGLIGCSRIALSERESPSFKEVPDEGRLFAVGS